MWLMLYILTENDPAFVLRGNTNKTHETHVLMSSHLCTPELLCQTQLFLVHWSCTPSWQKNWNQSCRLQLQLKDKPPVLTSKSVQVHCNCMSREHSDFMLAHYLTLQVTMAGTGVHYWLINTSCWWYWMECRRFLLQRHTKSLGILFIRWNLGTKEITCC
jgi:hypothetical protein